MVPGFITTTCWELSASLGKSELMRRDGLQAKRSVMQIIFSYEIVHTMCQHKMQRQRESLKPFALVVVNTNGTCTKQHPSVKDICSIM